MLETIVTKENSIRAAADGDIETLGLFFRQFLTETSKSIAEAPEQTIPIVQWKELVTTLFREAIANGQLGVVRLLLTTPVVQHVEQRELLLSHLLAWAVQDDYCEIVECLLTNGANPNLLISTDDEDDTAEELRPLHLAVQLGSLDIAQTLLAHGALVNTHCETDGSTALHEAARQDESEMIHLLIQHGGNINAVDDRVGESPLHVAAKKGNLKAMQILIRCHANLNQVNRRGHCAMDLARIEGHHAIVQLLDATMHK